MLSYASWLGEAALLLFLIAILNGGASVVFPGSTAARVMGTATLFFGLIGMFIAIVFELLESVLAKREIDDETADLDSEAKKTLGDLEI